MPTSQFTWFGAVTLTAAATAQSVGALITSSSLTYPFSANATGPVVSLSFSADKNLIIGPTAASTDDTHGITLAAGQYFQDSGQGFGSNAIPLSQIFLFAPTAGGTVTVSIYVRSC